MRLTKDMRLTTGCAQQPESTVSHQASRWPRYAMTHIRSRLSETAVVDLSETSVQDHPLPNPVNFPTTDSTGNVVVAPTPPLGLRCSSHVRQPSDHLSYGPSSTSL